MSKEAANSLVRHCSPAWYASVTGTGGLANVPYLFSAQVAFLRPVAITLGWLNVALSSWSSSGRESRGGFSTWTSLPKT